MEGQRPSSPSAEGEIQSRCASGATPKEGKAARRPPADVPAAAILKKLRHDAPLIHPKRKTAPASRSVCRFFSRRGFFWGSGLCRTASCGEPLDRVPHGQTSHRDVWPPFLIFWYHLGDFALCGGRGRGFAPSIPTSLLEKAGSKTFFVYVAGRFPRVTQIVAA